MGEITEKLKKIDQILTQRVRPQLQEHDGDILPLSYRDNVFTFRLTGGCAGCPAADSTIENIVKKELQAAMPEIKEVVAANGVSQELYQLGRSLLTHHKD